MFTKNKSLQVGQLGVRFSDDRFPSGHEPLRHLLRCGFQRRRQRQINGKIRIQVATGRRRRDVLYIRFKLTDCFLNETLESGSTEISSQNIVLKSLDEMFQQ